KTVGDNKASLLYFYANVNYLRQGQSTTFSWSCRNVDNVFITGPGILTSDQQQAPKGSLSVTPDQDRSDPQLYTIKGTPDEDNVTHAEWEVQVMAPEVTSFELSNASTETNGVNWKKNAEIAWESNIYTDKVLLYVSPVIGKESDWPQLQDANDSKTFGPINAESTFTLKPAYYNEEASEWKPLSFGEKSLIVPINPPKFTLLTQERFTYSKDYRYFQWKVINASRLVFDPHLPNGVQPDMEGEFVVIDQDSYQITPYDWNGEPQAAVTMNCEIVEMYDLQHLPFSTFEYVHGGSQSGVPGPVLRIVRSQIAKESFFEFYLAPYGIIIDYGPNNSGEQQDENKYVIPNYYCFDFGTVHFHFGSQESAYRVKGFFIVAINMIDPTIIVPLPPPPGLEDQGMDCTRHNHSQAPPEGLTPLGIPIEKDDYIEAFIPKYAYDKLGTGLSSFAIGYLYSVVVAKEKQGFKNYALKRVRISDVAFSKGDRQNTVEIRTHIDPSNLHFVTTGYGSSDKYKIQAGPEGKMSGRN
ncbi:MAG: hypothetical protein AAF828_09920, partial [Bacteroidota bacterium]